MPVRKRRLIRNSILPNVTGARNFATGFRRGHNRRGRVMVGRVGRFFGVFDSEPQPGIAYTTIREGIEFGNQHLRKRR